MFINGSRLGIPDGCRPTFEGACDDLSMQGEMCAHIYMDWMRKYTSKQATPKCLILTSNLKLYMVHAGTGEL